MGGGAESFLNFPLLLYLLSENIKLFPLAAYLILLSILA